MKIAFIGAGGVGGYFGGRLAAAGEDVAFIARGAHLAALRDGGLRLDSARGDLHAARFVATDRPAEIGPVELVLVAVKLPDTEAAAAAAGPLVGPHTVVASLQNGVDAEDRIRAALPGARVEGALCHIAAAVAAPGRIRHVGTMARITVGTFDGGACPAFDALGAACARAGFDFARAPDIRRAIWEKFVFLATFSGLTALTRLPKGPILADPETRGLFRAALEEVAAVARARGVDLPADQADRTLAFADGLPAEMTSSMLTDLERGNRLELPWLSGAVARLGAAAGVPTPIHGFIAAALKPHAAGAR